jgi:hypothetical protein
VIAYRCLPYGRTEGLKSEVTRFSRLPSGRSVLDHTNLFLTSTAALMMNGQSFVTIDKPRAVCEQPLGCFMFPCMSAEQLGGRPLREAATAPLARKTVTARRCWLRIKLHRHNDPISLTATMKGGRLMGYLATPIAMRTVRAQVALRYLTISSSWRARSGFSSLKWVAILSIFNCIISIRTS